VEKGYLPHWGAGRGLGPFPHKKMNFSIKVACFAAFGAAFFHVLTRKNAEFST